MYANLLWSLFLLLVAAVILRILLRRHRSSSSRIAWITIVLALPLLGVIAYFLLGEVNLGRRHARRMSRGSKALPPPDTLTGSVDDKPVDDEVMRSAHLFKLGQSISGFAVQAGNSAQLMGDSNSAIDAMVADIDAAQDHVHVSFYIWLPDNNGRKVIEALQRAAQRGVSCRALVDGLGSRSLIKSKHWKAMTKAGIHTAVALPVKYPLLSPLVGRADLRNHRKIVIVDNAITYCGSQNCADPEFLVKARYAPWVDILLRFEGPVVQQNQYLFATDWIEACGENLSSLLQASTPHAGGFSAQVIGTGPSFRYSAMPEVFIALLNTARREVLISTPYYVPNEAMQDALCATAYRGVTTSLILPARNDSLFVAAASRSCFEDLLEAGVRLYEFKSGLLHAKTFTLDGEVALIGSANMDRRSFDLNFENNILLHDAALTAAIVARQRSYIEQSERFTSDNLADWSLRQRLWNNTMAMLGPVL